MKNMTDINNSAFYYSANMLRMLLNMKLIDESEYERIIRILQRLFHLSPLW